MAGNQVDYVNQIVRGPFVDVRTAPFNAKCDGVTDNGPLLNAMKAAGFNCVFIPANCIITQAHIPDHMVIMGENRETSIVRSNTTPDAISRTTLAVGPGTTLINLNGQCSGVGEAGGPDYGLNGWLGVWINYGESDEFIVNEPKGNAFTAIGRYTYASNPMGSCAIFFQVMGGDGDGMNSSSGSGNTGGGNAARFDVYESAVGECLYLANWHSGAGGGGGGLGITKIPQQSPTSTATPIGILDYTSTSNSEIIINQRQGNMTGAVFNIAMADISGTFTGPLLGYSVAGQTKLTILNNGAFNYPAPQVVDSNTAGGVINVASQIIRVTGTTLIQVINPPLGGSCMQITVVKTDSGSIMIGGGGNVPVAHVLAQNGSLTLSYVAGSWY